jgi:hypothetical protein
LGGGSQAPDLAGYISDVRNLLDARLFLEWRDDDLRPTTTAGSPPAQEVEGAARVDLSSCSSISWPESRERSLRHLARGRSWQVEPLLRAARNPAASCRWGSDSSSCSLPRTQRRGRGRRAVAGRPSSGGGPASTPRPGASRQHRCESLAVRGTFTSPPRDNHRDSVLRCAAQTLGKNAVSSTLTSQILSRTPISDRSPQASI